MNYAPEELDWPPWTLYVSGGVAVVIAAAVGLQRHAFFPPTRNAVFVVAAAVPWILGAADVLVSRVLWVALVVTCVIGLMATPVQADFAPFFLIFLVGTIGSVDSWRWGAATALVSVAAVVLMQAVGEFENAAVIWSFGILFAWAAGSGLRWQLVTMTELHRAQAGLAERAAADERQRVAREVHDVIAHSLSVTMLHLTGARMALEDGDHEEARTGLTEAESAGRQAMADIRRTMGLLAPTGSTGTAAPQPSASDVVELVNSFRDAGLDVAVDLRGDLAHVPPTTGVALYRIVQESLSNVAKHAGGPATVVIDVADEAVAIDVTNPVLNGASPNGGGFGLDGMRQRAHLLGGTLTVERDGGLWRVAARLPRSP